MDERSKARSSRYRDHERQSNREVPASRDGNRQEAGVGIVRGALPIPSGSVSRAARLAAAALAMVVVLVAAAAHASAPLMPYQEYGKRLEKAEMASPLTDQLFGESINLYNGATEFSVVDIDLPGNSALPVRLGRRFRVQSRKQNDDLGGFQDWDIEVPYLSSYNWSDNQAHMPDRCSQMWRPYTPTGFQLEDFWHGSQLHLPGEGSQPLLWIGSAPPPGSADYPKPAAGGPHYWGTRGHHRLSCIPMANGYYGQGFLAIDASGTRYYFDIGFQRQSETIYKRVMTTFDHLTPHARYKTYLVVRRMEDRFGNWVNYDWSNGRLNSVTANDGRSISLTYEATRTLARTNTSMTWTYEFDQSGLRRVIRPDLSQWKYEKSGWLDPNYTGTDFDTAGPNCAESLEAPDAFTLKATHPSGAVGTFDFHHMRHRRSGLPTDLCQWVYRDLTTGQDRYALAIPEYFDVYSIVQKSITGPGVPGMAWHYAYDIVTHGRTGYGLGSPAKTVSVDQPDGSRVDYRFGIQYAINDGRLLETLKRDVDGRIVRSESHRYMTRAEAQQMPFPEFNGGIAVAGDDPVANWNLPVVSTQIRQDGDIPEPEPYMPPAPPPPPPPCPPAQCPPPPPCEINPVTGVCDDPMIVHDPNVPGSGVQQRSTAQPASGTPATTFTRDVTAFDVFARPVSVTRYSSMGDSKTDTTTYHDNLSAWVLGQVQRSTTNGIETARTDFNAQAQPWRTFAFGKLQQTLTYHADGTLATVADGNNNTIAVSGWKRGIPQLIQHPATPDQPSGASQSAVVDDHGWIRSVTDEHGAKHCYDYDTMGRLTQVMYPSETQPQVCDESSWNAQNSAFVQLTSSHWLPPGILPGYWRQVVLKGNYLKAVYLDALWRPVMELEYDGNDVSGSMRSKRTGYDASGRVALQTYPVAGADPSSSGTRTFYDALDRTTRVEQDSELGVLATTTEYLPGLRTRVTNPRGQSTTNGYQAYDQPGYDLLRWSVQPEGKVVEIFRHPHLGAPEQLRQRNQDGSLQHSRYYVYDGYRQLCKTIEPETGATIMSYDAAGNLAWSASGHQGLGDLGSCNHAEGYWWGRRIDRTYDARNRLKTLAFPDGNGSQAWTYTADGKPASITTTNDGGSTSLLNTYSYNRRGLLIAESLTQPGWYSWGLGYGYSRNGHLASHGYPGGEAVSYAPNALGQATQVASQFATYASGASYYPNGALKQFTDGNGLVHTMTQNARQLPARSTDGGGALDHAYSYDANGNVDHIWDHAQDTGNGYYGRWMTYDGLDRLTAAGSCRFGGDCWHRFTYDALDNLTSWKLTGVKDYASYGYDANHRLTNVRNSAGATVVGLGYDAQGNLANKNGQQYTFDYGNRLRQSNPSDSGLEAYRYDGHGRRVLAWHPAQGNILSQYGHDGVLRYQHDSRKNKVFNYQYLAGSLVAIRETPMGTANHAFRYQHTDALGSPVAVSNEAGQVIDRTAWEPYGAAIGKPAYDGAGYTGHIMDGVTGLTYMQQRYYDPGIGRFLSVDPVTANTTNGTNFNRYWYANNNPYKFTDPDGRCSELVNSFVGGLPCHLQQRNLNPAHVAADRAVTRDAEMLVNAQVNIALTATAFGGAWRARAVLAEPRVKFACLLGISACAGNLQGSVNNLGKLDDAVNHLRGRAETLGRMTERLRRDGTSIRPPPNSGGAGAGRAAGQKSPDGFQGVFRVEGRLDSRRLDKELKTR